MPTVKRVYEATVRCTIIVDTDRPDVSKGAVSRLTKGIYEAAMKVQPAGVEITPMVVMEEKDAVILPPPAEIEATVPPLPLEERLPEEEQSPEEESL